ncbi:MAG: UvrD-helicase domain-containing protein [Candidatus Hydrogenedens sp.]|jgi:superfamily I DNA and RNA helicase|nr:UvrD-helicase domain-containing protein [Candidatus Hydrogenedens sp.]
MKPTVAISSDFLNAFSRIPRSQQRRVREFMERFRENPTSSGINYEKIHAVRDEKIRTVRISRDYRGIVLHPERGNVYILLWVDHHDEAMEWAGERVFDVNPTTGALQVVNVNAAEQMPEARKEESVSETAEALFTHVSDRDLASVGVPAVLMPSVRALKNRNALYELEKHLPEESAEALRWLAEGFTAEEVREVTAGTAKVAAVNTNDFTAALKHPDSERRFVTINSQHDLTAILSAPLEKWRVFLHPAQKRMVEKRFNGPAKVTGGAGTGKTVVAMHRARYLVREVFTESTDRILVTTFTKNLAKDVKQNLKNLCGDEFKRIEVVHLHDWAVKFMKMQGFSFQIATDDDRAGCWNRAVGYTGQIEWSLHFLRDEWEKVVQNNDLQTRQDYLKVRRVGRGKTLSRKDRAALWEVFEQYRDALKELGKVEWSDVIRQTRLYLEGKSRLPYRAVVVDEAQDFFEEEWRLIRALVPENPNDLFIVGDAHQRIYGPSVVLGRCDINIRGRSHKLRINYRTTEQIKNWALALLHGIDVDDLDGGIDDQAGYTSLFNGPEPDIHFFHSLHEEKDFLVQHCRELLSHGRAEEDICVAARNARMLKTEYQPVLQEAGFNTAILDKDSDGSEPGVRLATMHRVKGLEFPCVILAGVNEGVIPYQRKGIDDDPVAQQEHNVRERSLLFVAATRSRDSLTITSSGHASPFIKLSR